MTEQPTKRQKLDNNINDTNTNDINNNNDKNINRPKLPAQTLLGSLFPVTENVKSRSQQLHLCSKLLNDYIYEQHEFNYAELCYIRDEIQRIRDEYCNPKSYDILQRSTKTIIDLNCSIGHFTICCGRKHDKYTNIIANDTSSLFIDDLKYNIYNQYHLKRVNITNDDFISFFNNQYATYTPNAVVYFDCTLYNNNLTKPDMKPIYSQNENENENDNDTTNNTDTHQQQLITNFEWETLYDNDPKSLTELCENLLNGSIFMTGKIICPMIVLRVPYNFDMNVIRNLPTRHTEIIDKDKASQILKLSFASNVAMLIGWHNTAEIIQQLQANSIETNTYYNTYNNSDIYVKPSTEQQIQTVVNLHNNVQSAHYHLWLRLKQIIQGQLYGCNLQANNMIDHLIKLVETAQQNNTQCNDEYIYNQLRTYYVDIVQKSDEYIQQQQLNNKTEGRANNRVAGIMELLGKSQPKYNNPYITAYPPCNIPIDNMLDVGCSEGSITAALGQALQLDINNIHGCDVREVVDRTGFTFRLQNNFNQLPYPDEHFTLVLCLMSLHHFDNVNNILQEIYRVMKPNGYLIIREHDLYPQDIALVLDIQHGLYARVWSIEQATFCNNYTAHYAERSYWSEQLYNNKLYACTWSHDQMTQPESLTSYTKHTKIKNPFNMYYGIYSKVEMDPPPSPDQNSIQQQQQNRQYNNNKKRKSYNNHYSDQQQQYNKNNYTGGGFYNNPTVDYDQSYQYDNTQFQSQSYATTSYDTAYNNTQQHHQQQQQQSYTDDTTTVLDNRPATGFEQEAEISKKFKPNDYGL